MLAFGLLIYGCNTQQQEITQEQAKQLAIDYMLNEIPKFGEIPDNWGAKQKADLLQIYKNIASHTVIKEIYQSADKSWVFVFYHPPSEGRYKNVEVYVNQQGKAYHVGGVDWKAYE